jgi:uncharacterized coiled-coil DUF342 family protein
MLSEFEAPHLHSLITEALAEHRTIPNLEQQIVQLTNRLRDQSIDREIAHLQLALGQPDLTPEHMQQIVHELNGLRKAKRTPLTGAKS